MRNSLIASGTAAAIAIGVVVALAGCGPVSPPRAKAGPHHPSAAPVASATPTPTATAVGLGPLPANALFRITATVTEPSGASADLVQTVFAPTAPDASDTVLLDAQCNQSGQPTWQSNYTSPEFLTTTITASLHHGSAAWSTNDQVSAYFLGSSSAFSGSYEVAQSDCAPGYIGIPGTIHGVGVVEAGDPISGSYGWASAFGLYGFDGGGNDPSAADSSGTGVVGNCAIEVSAAASAASPVAAAWATQAFVPARGCTFTASGS
jgi:hypothetical protein